MEQPVQISELEVAHSEIEMLKADREMTAKIMLARNNEVAELRRALERVLSYIEVGNYYCAKKFADHTKIRTTSDRIKDGDYE